MIDKETFGKEIVRMWDSIRDDEYKGIESCSGVNSCDECPLNNIGCGESLNAFEFIEAVEKWSKEHQPKKSKCRNKNLSECDIISNSAGTIRLFKNKK